MRNYLIILSVGFTQILAAQSDSSFFKRAPPDSNQIKLNMDAVYQRPFLQAGKLPVAIGGYIEGNSNYTVEDGVDEGLSFQLPRLTVFVSSTIKRRIKFLTEIELEEGGREINIEFASVDVEFHPLLNLRGGIVMNPIGAFNQNHDGPKWEFVNRPLSATTIIPSTWSNVGFGFFGKYGRNNLVWAYEAYLTNGFDESIIANKENRTWLPASKQNPERYEESSNGIPLTTLKTALRHRKVGEIGISWMGGVYNKFQEDGIELDQKRRVDLYALDFNTTILKTRTYIVGEFVISKVDVPKTYSQQFGVQQQGGFVDIVQTIIKRKILDWENSTINLALRTEFVDYNVGSFQETNGNIWDHVYSIAPGISFRPSPQTVFRANYQYKWQRDILGNPSTRSASILIGISSYF